MNKKDQKYLLKYLAKTIKELQAMLPKTGEFWESVAMRESQVNKVINKKYKDMLEQVNFLLKHNLRLVYFFLDEIKLNNLDCFQEAVLGLRDAIVRYDPLQGELSTYAKPWIVGRARRAYRSNQIIRTSREVPSLKRLPLEMLGDIVDPSPSPEKKAIIRDLYNKLSLFIENELSDREQDVLLTFINGVPAEAAADKLNISLSLYYIIKNEVCFKVQNYWRN